MKIVLSVFIIFLLLYFNYPSDAEATSGRFFVENNYVQMQISLDESDISEINAINMDSVTKNVGCGSPHHFYKGYMFGFGEDIVNLSDGNDNSYFSNRIVQFIRSGGNEDIKYTLLSTGTFTDNMLNEWSPSVATNGEYLQLFVDVYNRDESCNVIFLLTEPFSITSIPYSFGQLGMLYLPMLSEFRVQMLN